MSKILITIFILAISITITAYISIKAIEIQLKQVIIEQTQEHLITIRDNKKQQIIAYITKLHKQIELYANNVTIVAAMRDLKPAFFQTKEFTEEHKEAVTEYYDNIFLTKYKELNGCLPLSLPKLKNETITRQYQYIIKKNNIISDEYYRLHKIYHKAIKKLQQFDIENILLVDAETNIIIYSLNKNIDFATELNKYSQINNTQIIDFNKYIPLYNNPIAFVETPILLNEKKIGRLILQINNKYINNITNRPVKPTVETYIVAKDGTMRNDSSKLLEYKEDYLLAVEQAGLPTKIVEEINLKNTSVGIQTINTSGTEAVFNGISGLDLYMDYNDEFVFAAFTPVNIFGLKWSIFTTIQESEVLDLIEQTMDKITFIVYQLTVIIFILMSIILWLITPTKPLIRKVNNSYTIEQIIQHIHKLN